MQGFLARLLACAVLLTARASIAQVISVSTPWQPIAGAAQDVAVSSKGEVMAVDPNGVVFRRDDKTLGWQTIGRGMVRVALGNDGSAWGVDQQGVVRRYEGSEWRAVGQGAVDIALAPGGNVLVATNNGTLAEFDKAKSTWRALPGAGTRVAVDGKARPWSVGADGAIARRLGEVWIGLPGKARDIAADASGRVVIAGIDGKVYEWLDEGGRWSEITGAETTVALAVAGAQLWRVDAAGKLFAKGSRSKPKPDNDKPVTTPAGPGATPPAAAPDLSAINFTRLATGFLELAIGADGSIFGINQGKELQRWSNAEQRFKTFPGSLGRVGVDANGLPYGLGSGGALVKHDGSAWRTQSIKFPVSDASLLATGEGLVVNAEGLAFRVNLSEALTGYTRVATDAERVMLAADGSFWYLSKLGLPVQCDVLSNCKRYTVRATDLAVGPGGTAFIVDDNQSLRRFNIGTGLFDLVRKGNTARVAVGPNDRPWILDLKGEVWASGQFARDESKDVQQAGQATATSTVTTTETPVTAVAVKQAYIFHTVDVPTSATGYPNLGGGLNNITVGHDDQIIVTGYDEAADPCIAKASGWTGGRNWIYSPGKRTFLYLDALKQVNYQVAIATRNPTQFDGYWRTDPLPAPSGAPAVPVFYASLRACERYFSIAYNTETFTNRLTDILYPFGGFNFLESLKANTEITANTRDITTVVDMDITLDDWLISIYPERKINFKRLGAGFVWGATIEKRADQKFARLGVGATRDVLWATSYEGDVYEYVKASDTFEKRNLFVSDRAQDIGVGKDGSVFIVDTAGRLKKWDKALKSFSTTGLGGVTRVAVMSNGKPVAANFPASQRVYIAR